MIIDSLSQLRSSKIISTNEPLKRKVLMAHPEYFDVLYSINPHMLDESGNLNKVDKNLALAQWQGLKDCYQKLGFETHTIPAVREYPDLVFTANQSLTFWNDGPGVLMSHMQSEFRRGEVPLLEKWYKDQNYKIHHLPEGSSFLEGNGDVIPHPGKNIFWGGCGPRTRKEVYAEVEKVTRKTIILLPLIHELFYHLDTCFSVLNENTVVFLPEAFAPETVNMIREMFPVAIETDLHECKSFFTGNCHSPDGKNVIYQKGAKRLEEKLSRAGFALHPLETSEFMKSGGSVFCMKMMAY